MQSHYIEWCTTSNKRIISQFAYFPVTGFDWTAVDFDAEIFKEDREGKFKILSVKGEHKVLKRWRRHVNIQGIATPKKIKTLRFLGFTEEDKDDPTVKDAMEIVHITVKRIKVGFFSHKYMVDRNVYKIVFL